jgi:hypothetical protein
MILRAINYKHTQTFFLKIKVCTFTELFILYIHASLREIYFWNMLDFRLRCFFHMGPKENQIQSNSIKRWSLGQSPLYVILTSWIVQGRENRLIFIIFCLSYIFNWILFLFSLTSFFIIFWFLVKPVTCISRALS